MPETFKKSRLLSNKNKPKIKQELNKTISNLQIYKFTIIQTEINIRK